MFGFDNNYVIPAAVAFYSLLEHANKKYDYKIYALHSDITLENQEKLRETIAEFADFSTLEFVDMSDKYDELWSQMHIKGHFTKETIYKILTASIFPRLPKLITSDVDVVFLDDVSESYFALDTTEDIYLAGVHIVGKIIPYYDNYKENYTEEEIEKVKSLCGGFLVVNLDKFRKDKMEEKFIQFFKDNAYRINQAEQDVLNLCCYPKTKKLPLRYIACTYLWDFYKTPDDFKNDAYYTETELQGAMDHPIQLHYATSVKPWKNVECTKSEEWFKYLVKTPFLQEFLQGLPYKIIIPKPVNRSKIRALLYRIKAIVVYVYKKPLFFLGADFYHKLFKKISKRMNKETIVHEDDK